MLTMAEPKPNRLILLIIVALLVWGVLHAVGAYLFGLGFWDLLKAAVVLACMLAFLGFWLLLLARRPRTKP